MLAICLNFTPGRYIENVTNQSTQNSTYPKESVNHTKSKITVGNNNGGLNSCLVELKT